MDKMKAAVFYGKKDLRVEKVDIPEVSPNDILIKVLYCGICGSDLHSYKEGMYVKKGQIMGHEFSGEVVKVGENVKDIEAGEIVTGFETDYCGECYYCQNEMYGFCPNLFKKSTGYGKPGAFAEYLKISNAVKGVNVIKVPDGLDPLSAATAEPTSIGITAVDKISPKESDKVVVLGAGLIGNATIQAFDYNNVEKIVASEVSDIRLKAARESGADIIINAKNENVLERCKEEVGVGEYHFNVGAMADAVVDAAGVPSTIWDSFEIVRSAGTIVFLGLPEEPSEIDITKIVHKNPRIIGSLGGDIIKSLDLLNKGEIVTKDLVTHEFTIDNIVEAFETQMNVDKSIKVMIKG